MMLWKHLYDELLILQNINKTKATRKHLCTLLPLYINSIKFESKMTQTNEREQLLKYIIVSKLDNRNDTNVAETRSSPIEINYLISSSLALQKVCLAWM